MNYLITGASRGIGFELVTILASQPNNTIMATARSEASLRKLQESCTQLPGKVITQPADLTNVASRQELITAAQMHFQHLDVLINNAGQLLNKPFKDHTAGDLNALFQTNVFAPFLLSQDMLPLLRKSQRAHIVNISSMGGVQGSAKFPGLSAYSASKGALAILTECMAEELKADRIAVNCLALGAVQTEMLTEAFPGYQAPLSANQMAGYIAEFSATGANFFNGKVLPVSVSTP